MTQLSNKMKEYFGELDTKLKNCYDVANTARSLGFDPSDKVEIPLARDMAERVEGLVSVVAPQMKGSGLSGRINELEQQHGSQNWLIAFLIAEEVAEEKFCKFSDKKEAMEVGLRVGLAYITNGVVSSPVTLRNPTINPNKMRTETISAFNSQNPATIAIMIPTINDHVPTFCTIECFFSISFSSKIFLLFAICRLPPPLNQNKDYD